MGDNHQIKFKYVFSEDFTNKVNEILSYDTNFNEIYNWFLERCC